MFFITYKEIEISDDHTVPGLLLDVRLCDHLVTIFLSAGNNGSYSQRFLLHFLPFLEIDLFIPVKNDRMPTACNGNTP